jgi:hypothetical protein
MRFYADGRPSGLKASIVVISAKAQQLKAIRLERLLS